MADALMAQANPQERQTRPEGADDVVGQAGFARRTRPGRNEDALRVELADLVNGNLVVAADFQGYLHLAQILDEIVGERIVIVYDQDHVSRESLTQTGENKRRNKERMSKLPQAGTVR